MNFKTRAAYPISSGEGVWSEAKKLLLIMNFTAIILLSACFAVSAKGFTQTVTLSEKNAPLERVFKEIKKQTGYDFLYENKLLQQAKKVDIEITNGSLEQVLNLCFKDQPLTWSIVGKIIVVKEKSGIPNAVTTTESNPPINISGKVTDKDG